MSRSLLRISLVSCVALSIATSGAIVYAQAKPAADAGATAPAGAAAAPAPSAPPQPAPELTNFMKDMLGTWNCATTFSAGAFGPGSPEMKATVKVKFSKEPQLAGFFYRGEYSMAKSKEMPMPMAGVFYLGYDSAAKLVLTVGVDSMGAASMGTGALTETSATWAGEGYMMGKKVKMREVMTKTGPKAVTHTYEVDMGKGFQKMGEDVCKK